MAVGGLEQDATVGNLRLHYREWNREQPQSIVCLHGFTGSSIAFASLATGLVERHVYSPDFRGHGDSEWAADLAYSVDDYVADLEGLVGVWGLQTFAMIGTSLGGYVAMRFAARHPEVVSALVINDIGPEDVPAQVDVMRSRKDVILRDFESFNAAAEAVDAMMGGRLPGDLVQLRTRALYRQAFSGRWVRKMDPGLLEHRFTQPLLPQPLWDELPQIACPTLLIWGTDSVWLSGEHAHRMVETIPHAELVSLPGVSHAPTLLEPAANKAVRRLLGVGASD